MVEADDAYTGAHSKGVVALVDGVAEILELSRPDRDRAKLTALLHDVGKINIPKEIINKPGKLTPEERAIIETHTVEGQLILERVGGVLGEVGLLVRSCHEHVDGNGYPDGLAGDAIPLVARIVCACDAYSAMTTDRSYRKARPPAEAVAEMRRCAGTQFDAAVVEALAQVIEEDERGGPRSSRRSARRRGPVARPPAAGSLRAPVSATEERPAARPILLAVDDDPAVARAVNRDLRRHYGARYRVLSTASGQEALNALEEITRRGEPVALLLADQRMPQMTGVEFMAEARALAPRRAPRAAHRLRRLAGRDRRHQPRRPRPLPHEAVGPARGAALPGPRRPARGVARDAAGGRRRPARVGHRFSRASHELRDFLARNLVPFRYVDVERDAARAGPLLAAAGLDGDEPEGLPLVLLDDGEALRAPDVAEVARRVGISRPATRELYDLVVVGGGPAGLAAAVYGASEGLETALVERVAHRRPGRPELAHRELPRLPRRPQRRGSDRPGHAAGAQVRRRDAAGARRRGPRGARRHARRCGWATARSSPPTPSSSRRASSTAAWRPPASRS